MSPTNRPLYTRVLAFSIVILTFIQMYQWMELSFLSWYAYNISILLLAIPFLVMWKKEKGMPLIENLPLYLYLIWITIGTVIALSSYSSRTYLPNIIRNCSGTLLIVSVLFLGRANILPRITKYWRIFTVPLSIILLPLLKTLGAFGFYICILQIYLILITVLKKRTIIISLILLFVVLYGAIYVEDMNRSSIVKYAIAFILAFVPVFKTLVKTWMLKLVRIACFSVPCVLIYLAILGDYNVFAENEESHSLEDFYTDTRTGVYTEALTSAVENDYVLMGRTPARGYDSLFQEKRTGDTERSSEVSIVNIFTWYGLIGVVLYTLLFWWIVGKGLFDSKNIYIKCIALYLCFRYLFAWIEDFNSLDASNITLWIMMSMCLIPHYREMSDKEFRTNIKFLNF